MKFNMSKKWCEQAALTEKECVSNIHLSVIPQSFFKVKKIKGLSTVIKKQEKFIEQVKLTKIFLKIYQGNPEEFEFLIGDDVWYHYDFDKGLENPEWMWECIDELTCDIIYGDNYFKITGNGLFVTLHFSKTRNKKFKELFEHFKSYADNEVWGI